MCVSEIDKLYTLRCRLARRIKKGEPGVQHLRARLREVTNEILRRGAADE